MIPLMGSLHFIAQWIAHLPNFTRRGDAIALKSHAARLMSVPLFAWKAISVFVKSTMSQN